MNICKIYKHFWPTWAMQNFHPTSPSGVPPLPSWLGGSEKSSYPRWLTAIGREICGDLKHAPQHAPQHAPCTRASRSMSGHDLSCLVTRSLIRRAHRNMRDVQQECSVEAVLSWLQLLISFWHVLTHSHKADKVHMKEFSFLNSNWFMWITVFVAPLCSIFSDIWRQKNMDTIWMILYNMFILTWFHRYFMCKSYSLWPDSRRIILYHHMSSHVVTTHQASHEALTFLSTVQASFLWFLGNCSIVVVYPSKFKWETWGLT